MCKYNKQLARNPYFTSRWFKGEIVDSHLKSDNNVGNEIIKIVEISKTYCFIKYLP